MGGGRGWAVAFQTGIVFLLTRYTLLLASSSAGSPNFDAFLASVFPSDS